MLHLIWKNYDTELPSSFCDLWERREFADVTLSVRDGSIQAHRLVISACSTVLHNILQQNNHPHPLIYLKDISISVLGPIVNFMYYGEIKIAEENINSFLCLAKELQARICIWMYL